MTPRTIRDNEGAAMTPGDMASPRPLDLSLPPGVPVPMEGGKIAPRLVSGACDEHHDEDWTPRIVYPSISEEGEDCFDDVELDYLVEPRVLGTGRHGVVRACVHHATGRRYALKSVRKGDPSVRPGGLAREVELLGEMEHGNVIGLVDVYEDADSVHLITELCEGGELFDRVVQRSAAENGFACFGEEEAARIMHQILSAVSYMHDRNIAHRDLKPENVLFQTREEGSPIKVVDFGLSRKHLGGRGPPMSTLAGTPYYAAPEVLRGSYGRECDLWSAGIIAYVLLCGYPPFNGDDVEQIHRRVLRGRLRFLEEEWGGTSAEAVDFVRRLLRAEPGERMTAGQALNHPWIVGRVVDAEAGGRRDNSSVEVLYEGTLGKHPAARAYGVSPPRRRVRTSMFGL